MKMERKKRRKRKTKRSRKNQKVKGRHGNLQRERRTIVEVLPKRPQRYSQRGEVVRRLLGMKIRKKHLKRRDVNRCRLKKKNHLLPR